MELLDDESAAGPDSDRSLILRLREANKNLLYAALSARDSLADAESALDNQERFFAVLAHELRSPLVPIKLVASALDALPESRDGLPRLRQTLTRQVEYLVHLVNGLDDVTRIKHGKLVLDMRIVRPAEAMETALVMARPLTEARQQHLTLQFPQDPLLVRGDLDRFVQVFFNLLSNAVKFTPSRGTISVALQRNGDSVSIAIQDSGPGIAPAFLPFMFDMFAQNERTPGSFAGRFGHWPFISALAGRVARGDGVNRQHNSWCWLYRHGHTTASIAPCRRHVNHGDSTLALRNFGVIPTFTSVCQTRRT